MKLLIITLLLFYNLTTLAQNQLVGDYQRSLSDTEGKHIIEYKLILNQDGTFLFHSYAKMQGGVPPETNKYGKGKWSAKDNLITFSADKKEDFDDKYTLNLNKTIARYVTKNPRDKSDKIVKTKLMLLESEIFWLQRLDIFKK